MAWLSAGAGLLTSFQGSVVFECDPSLFTFTGGLDAGNSRERIPSRRRRLSRSSTGPASGRLVTSAAHVFFPKAVPRARSAIIRRGRSCCDTWSGKPRRFRR